MNNTSFLLSFDHMHKTKTFTWKYKKKKQIILSIDLEDFFQNLVFEFEKV